MFLVCYKKNCCKSGVSKKWREKKSFLSCLRHHNFLQITKVAEQMLDLLGRIIYLNSTHFLQEKTWNSLDEKPWMKDIGHNT